jgi:predicted metal-dependent peptidase
MRILENATYALLKTEPFYASFLLNSKIVFDNKKEMTAYACVRNGTTVLGFGVPFLESLKPEQVQGVIKHEILHLLFDHTNPKSYDIKNKAQMHNWNIAMDCANNQYIAHLPDGAVTLAALSKAVEKQLLPFQSAEYYYEQMEQAPDHCKQQMEGLEPLDDHDKNQEGDNGPGKPMSEQDKAIAKGIVHKKAQEAVRAAKGLVPGELVSAIEALSDKPLVNWKQLLRNFVANATSNKNIGTRKKTNRRFGFDYPGKKKKRELTLGVCIDSSGSVSDEQFNLFMSEIQEISKHITAAHLVYADCVVQKVIKVDNKKKIPLERFGNGGTAYQPAISKCAELKCDAILYFGDMDSADNPQDPQKPFLWVVVGRQTPPGNFGKVIYLDGKE